MEFSYKPIAHLTGSNGSIHALAYSASPGTYVLTGSSDRTIRLYNPTASNAPTHTSNTITSSTSQTKALPQGRLIQSYSAHGYEVLGLSVSSDNERFVSCGGDRGVFLWDVATAQTTRRFGNSGSQGHTSRVNCVAFAGIEDSVVVSGGFDTTVRIWDVRSNNSAPIQVLSEARDAITCLAVRDVEIIAGSVDGHVRAYDIRAGKCVVDTMPASVTSLSLAQDGKTVLVSSLDSGVRLFDRSNGSCLQRYVDPSRKNTEFRVQTILGARETLVLAGDEGEDTADGNGRLWVWDLLTAKLVRAVDVPWGPESGKKRVAAGITGDARRVGRRNVVSSLAWRDGGWGDQFCVAGTSGVVTVFGR